MAFFSINARHSLRWLLAEITVVVLGILIAFQIDQWREERGNERFIQASLQSMLTDLGNDEADLDIFIERSEPQIQAIAEFIDYLSSSDSREESRLIDLYRRSLLTRIWQPISPTYDSLRETGDFSLIRDPELRSALFLYHEWTDYIRRTVQNYEDARQRFIEATLQDFHQLTFLRDTRAIALTEPVRPVPPFTEIPRNPEMIGALGRYGRGISFLRPLLIETRERNRELQDLIRAHLEDR